jgi:hypothetical protein
MLLRWHLGELTEPQTQQSNAWGGVMA